MAYLNCRRCGLELKVPAAPRAMKSCPRCLARRTVVALTISSSPKARPNKTVRDASFAAIAARRLPRRPSRAGPAVGSD
jgi:hypothetical protein